MFRRHRDDLLEVMDRERVVWRMLVTVLADEVEFLRYMTTQAPHMSSALRNLTVEDVEQPTFGDGEEIPRAYLTEEEEELLALRLNDHISEQKLREMAEELDIPVPSLEVDE